MRGACSRRHAWLRQSRISHLLGVFSSCALRRPVGFDRGCDLELFEHKARQAAGSAINHGLSALRPQIRGNNADQRVSFLLRLHWLRNSLETEAGPLLRVLQLRVYRMSADSKGRVMLFVKSRRIRIFRSALAITIAIVNGPSPGSTKGASRSSKICQPLCRGWIVPKRNSKSCFALPDETLRLRHSYASNHIAHFNEVAPRFVHALSPKVTTLLLFTSRRPN
jgi:hypothetical protein